MAVVYEEFIRCGCGSPDFKEERIHTFHKKLLPRLSKEQELAPIETIIKYVCTSCGKELPR